MASFKIVQFHSNQTPIRVSSDSGSVAVRLHSNSDPTANFNESVSVQSTQPSAKRRTDDLTLSGRSLIKMEKELVLRQNLEGHLIGPGLRYS